MTVEAVVFDVGNVLIEWDRDRLYRQLIVDPEQRRDFYASVLTTDVNLALDAGASFAKTLSALGEEHPRWRSEILAFDQSWDLTLGSQDQEMVNLLADLENQDVPVFVLTNFSAEKWPVATARHPWLLELTGAVVSGHEGLTKPDRRIYDTLTDRYCLDPTTTWFTDDSQPNIEGATSAGWQADLFTDAARTRHTLERVGVLSIASR